MTKKELGVAQYLYNIWYWNEKRADDLDPTRKHRGGIIANMINIGINADRAFHTLTGRYCRDIVSESELNTEFPAEWAKKHKPIYLWSR